MKSFDFERFFTKSNEKSSQTLMKISSGYKNTTSVRQSTLYF